MTRKAESGEPPISTLLDTSAPPSLEDWGFEEDKAFENALAEHWFDDAKWDKIASILPNKDSSDVEQRYLILEEDVSSIESGSTSLPAYVNSVQPEPPAPVIPPQPAAKRKAPDQERRKGIPWTEEEHRAFLMGLAKFGKGDWRSISRSFVVSRTPTQVASHAQKYFIRLNSMNKKDKRRSSIHDITSATPPTGVEVAGVMPQFGAPNMAMPGSLPMPPAMGMGAGGPVQW